MPPKHKPHYLGHRQRVKAKFLQNSENFADYELLELLLFSSHTRKDVKELAKTLLTKFGSIKAMLQADFEALKSFKGVNINTLISLKLINEILTRSSKEKITHKPIINSWKQLIDYCQIVMAELKEEQFRVLFLDKKHQLISEEIIKNGQVENVEIDIRQIIKQALNHSAGSAILFHNHPNNSAHPSKMDIDTTKKIADSLKLINVQVYDHLIIGKNAEIYSFKSEGLL